MESFLKHVIEQMNVRVNLSCQAEGDRFVVSLSGQDVARVIGRHGQTLNALQLLAQGVLNRCTDRPLHVVIDAEGYRKRREETLVRLAKIWRKSNPNGTRYFVRANECMGTESHSYSVKR